MVFPLVIKHFLRGPTIVQHLSRLWVDNGNKETYPMQRVYRKFYLLFSMHQWTKQVLLSNYLTVALGKCNWKHRVRLKVGKWGPRTTAQPPGDWEYHEARLRQQTSGIAAELSLLNPRSFISFHFVLFCLVTENYNWSQKNIIFCWPGGKKTSGSL